MTTPHSARRFRRAAAVALLAMAAGACGLEEQPIPNGPTGPSGLANAFALTASPSVLPRDGQSLSTVTLRATDVTGGPLAGQRFRVRVSPSDAASTTEVTTDAAGRATFSVTAPPITSPATDISITATAEGGFSDASSRVLSIPLSGNPNTGPPVPSFTVSPATPEIDQLVTFNATATTDEGAACPSTCSFNWTFSDGQTASGLTVTRTFSGPGAYAVTLTVTDPATVSASTTLTVTVADIAAPTVTAPTVMPSTPLVNQPAVFQTTATADATGHRIVEYAWAFGDGTTATTTTNNVTKTYTAPGLYVVHVTVTDDAGRTSSAAARVTVATSAVW